MTLGTDRGYDAAAVPRRGEHAVVVGASIAGLLAARVLADAYDRVTVVDRDGLPENAASRRSTPQDEHVHVLLEAGRETLEALFPGFGDDLRAAGGLVIDTATELQYHERGDFLADGDEPLPMACASRPLYEHVLRERVAALDAVTVHEGVQCTDFRHDDGSNRVTGIVTDDASVDERAALVVDATGRASRTPAWLAANGYDRPPVDEVDVDLAYATTTIPRPPDDQRAFLVVPTPPETRGGTAIPVEGDRWVVTLFGLHGDHPPTTPTGFRRFAANLPTGALADLLDGHALDGDGDSDGDGIRQYPFSASLRRRYGDLDTFPDGLLVVGDAIASFNPIYGQGMSVAALDALALHSELAGEGAGAGDGTRSLADRFFESITEHRDVVWQMAVVSDFEFAETTGPRPRGASVLNWYLGRVVRTAQTDPGVSTAFARVLRLEAAPETLFAPSVLWRVLRPEALSR